MTLESLKSEAEKSATWRGHKLGPWNDDRFGRSSSECVQCKTAHVFVDPKPLPNGIDISGEAVAINCDCAP